MTYVIFNTLFILLRIIEVATLVAVFMSWIMPRAEVRIKLEWLLSPFLAPFRWINMKIAARTRGMALDLSYFLLLIGIEVVRALLIRMQIYLMF